MLWIDNWDKQWKIIKDQHLKATGNVINLTDTEIRKLKFTLLPSDVASTLEKADFVSKHNFFTLSFRCSTIDNM